MNRSHRSPKKWLRPGSRQWRNAQDPEITSTDILKAHYTDGWRPAAWAKTALEFGWMTQAQYCLLPKEHWERDPRGRIDDMSCYESSAFYRMCRRIGAVGLSFGAP